MKIHLHETQFDGWPHAACGRLEAKTPDDKRIVSDEKFGTLPKISRCVYCSKIHYPHGEN